MAMGAGEGRRYAGDELERLMQQGQASVRGKVDHLFFYVKKMLDYGKTHYGGLGKKENRLVLLAGFANLLRAESSMM